MSEQHKSMLINLALKTGEEVLKIYYAGFKTKYKEDNSPITEADIVANRIIIERLKQTSIPVISEESVNEKYRYRSNYDEFWIIDPIDGTKQFIRNDNEFTINIARISGRNVTEGVVYAPALRQLYYGHIEYGAIRINYNNNAYAELPDTETSETVILTSKSHMDPETEALLEKIKINMDSINIIPTGSSIKLCRVAEGSADIYLRAKGINEWDIAAGHAILKAAGGNIYKFKSKKEIRYNTKNLQTGGFFAVLDDKYRELLNDLI